MSTGDAAHYGWRLFKREEKTYEGQDLFFERWVHDASRSGIVFYSYPEAGRVRYIVEGYGTGTINPVDFSEATDMAPIQRSEHNEYQEAREALTRLMEDNYRGWAQYRNVYGDSL